MMEVSPALLLGSVLLLPRLKSDNRIVTQRFHLFLCFTPSIPPAVTRSHNRPVTTTLCIVASFSSCPSRRTSWQCQHAGVGQPPPPPPPPKGKQYICSPLTRLPPSSLFPSA